jgi:hypothetical protein
MERLTYKFQGQNLTNEINGSWLTSPAQFYGTSVDRLAAYEDTGLMPEGIQKLKSSKLMDVVALNNLLQTELEQVERKNKALENANKRAYEDGFNDCKKADDALIAKLRRELEQQRSASETKLINDIEKFKHLFNSTLAEFEQVKAERDKAVEDQWIEKASDGTDYVLAYADGVYCVTDERGRVICEFIRGIGDQTRTDAQEPWKQKIMNDFTKVE